MPNHSISRKAQLLGRHTKLIQLFIIMVVVIAIISFFLPNKFLTLINFQSMASKIPEFGLLAIAMSLSLITGGIDLSIVAIANLCGVIMALILSKIGPGAGHVESLIILAILAGLLLSLLCGFINGFLISGFGVPPILATLGTQGLFLGLAIVITKGYGIQGFPEQFLFIGNERYGGYPCLSLFSSSALCWLRLFYQRQVPVSASICWALTRLHHVFQALIITG